ncbi:MAG TPA: hypothetical protein VF233_11355 [Nitrososphaeraceae archaeon]|jgi:hypothetical protein|nr:hypothetical protein [Thermoproteota archaeon]
MAVKPDGISVAIVRMIRKDSVWFERRNIIVRKREIDNTDIKKIRTIAAIKLLTSKILMLRFTRASST